MADSYSRVVASGNTAVFAVPFPYLDRRHVFVFIGEKIVQAQISWVSSNSINLGAAPAKGTVVTIFRRTPPEPLVDFTPGNLDTRDLNVATKQAIFMAQEAADQAADNLSSAVEGGPFEAHGRKIVNLKPGEKTTDAVTLGQVHELAGRIVVTEEFPLDLGSIVGVERRPDEVVQAREAAAASAASAQTARVAAEAARDSAASAIAAGVAAAAGSALDAAGSVDAARAEALSAAASAAQAIVDAGAARTGAVADIRAGAPERYDTLAKVASALETYRSVLDFIPRQHHSAIRDGTSTYDASAVLQQALANEPGVDFSTIGSGKLVLGSPVPLSGRRVLRGARSILFAGWTGAPDRGIFESIQGQNLQAEFSSLRFLGPASALKFKQNTDTDQGSALDIFGCEFGAYSEAKTSGTIALDLMQVDFLRVSKCIVVNKGMFYNIRGNPLKPTRDNTQLEISSCFATQVDTAGFIERADKFRVNTDVMYCGAGLIFGGGLKRGLIDQSHVEYFGHAGYSGMQIPNGKLDMASGNAVNFDTTGYGHLLLDDGGHIALKFQQCSAFPIDNAGAKVGIYKGPTKNGARSDVEFERCYTSPTNANNPAYRPLELHQQAKWSGSWEGLTAATNLFFGDVNDLYTDIAIDEGPFNAKGDGNRSLLPGPKLINLRNSNGSPVVTEDSEGVVRDGHLVTFSAAGELYESVYLAQGWHTMFVTGYPKTGTPQISVRTDDANLFSRIARQFNYSSSYERPMRIPFFIANAGMHRVGIRAASASSGVVGVIALFRGFYTRDGVTQGGWDVPPVLALPTPSAKWRGKTLLLDKLGAAEDEVYCCVRTSGGHAWKLTS